MGIETKAREATENTHQQDKYYNLVVVTAAETPALKALSLVSMDP